MIGRTPRWAGGPALAVMLLAVPVLGQEAPVPAGQSLPSYARAIQPAAIQGGPVYVATTNGLPNILLTGYWPPTNEMLRAFSPNSAQNPGAWVGEDWEQRGYNVYAYFPEFPDGLGKGEGDFEVDYQDTSNDWWSLLTAIKPIALITFSRANTAMGWELEGGNRVYADGDWTNDYLAPFQPTPELPSFAEPPGTERLSTQPVDAIIAAVTASGAAVDPFSTVIDNGRFLSNYLGYHGNWWRDLHADPARQGWCIAGGHIHVGRFTALPDAVLATEVTVRVLIAHVDARRDRVDAGDLNGDGEIDLADLARLTSCLSGPDEVMPPPLCPAALFDLTDLDNDGDVDLADAALLLSAVDSPGR